MIVEKVLKSSVALGLSSLFVLNAEVHAVSFGQASSPGAGNQVIVMDGVVQSMTVSDVSLAIFMGGPPCVVQLSESANAFVNPRVAITRNAIPLLRKSMRESLPIKLECIYEERPISATWIIAYE